MPDIQISLDYEQQILLLLEQCQLTVELHSVISLGEVCIVPKYWRRLQWRIWCLWRTDIIIVIISNSGVIVGAVIRRVSFLLTRQEERGVTIHGDAVPGQLDRRGVSAGVGSQSLVMKIISPGWGDWSHQGWIIWWSWADPDKEKYLIVVADILSNNNDRINDRC